MRQRAALARTLCPEPDILLLDEPFSALDFQTRLALSDEIAGILAAEQQDRHPRDPRHRRGGQHGDRVVVMSRRPGPHQVGAPHQLSEFRTGAARRRFEARKCAEFGGYFQTIWDELDLHRSNRQKARHEQ